MKAIRLDQYGGPERLRYEDAPEPRPAEGQVLVRVQAASVNPGGTDFGGPMPPNPAPPGRRAFACSIRVGERWVAGPSQTVAFGREWM
jgi:hypothetical protein